MAIPQWEYMFITVSNTGDIRVLDNHGKPGLAPEKGHILGALNELGAQGWELVQGGPNQDSSGATYVMKRQVEPPKKKGQAGWM